MLGHRRLARNLLSLTHTAARVSGHLKSTDCSDVSKASAPDKEAAPEGPILFELPVVCVCVRARCVCVGAGGRRFTRHRNTRTNVIYPSRFGTPVIRVALERQFPSRFVTAVIRVALENQLSESLCNASYPSRLERTHLCANMTERTHKRTNI